MTGLRSQLVNIRARLQPQAGCRMLLPCRSNRSGRGGPRRQVGQPPREAHPENICEALKRGALSSRQTSSTSESGIFLIESLR